MIFAMRKSPFYNTFGRQKSIIRFSLFGFSELLSSILNKKSWEIALIQPFGATKTGMETYHLPARCLQHPNTPNQRQKSLSTRTLHPETCLPTLATPPDEETSPVILRSTACFLSLISQQHGLTTVSSSLLPTVVSPLP